MSTPNPPDSGDPAPAERPPPDPTSDAPFDPYRFGLPDHPVPAEYAPPGYVFPPTPPAGPQPNNPWAPPSGLPPTQAGSMPPAGPPQYPPQYPQYGPPPPTHHEYGQPKPGNGKAVTALTLGILSIIFFWLTVLDLALIIPAVVFGVLGLGDAKVRNSGGRGQAIAGLICAAVAVVLIVVALIVVLHAAGKCGGFSHSGDPGFNQCLKDNL
jgi:hypothetical protein